MNEIQVIGEVLVLRDGEILGESVAIVASDSATYEVPFRPVDRYLMCRVYQARPLLRLRVKGRVEGFVFAPDRTIELVEHTRFSELLNVQIRLDNLMRRTDDSPTEEAQMRASDLLCRLLADDPKLPVPRILPTEDRGVVAVWSEAELTFNPDGSAPHFEEISRCLGGVS